MTELFKNPRACFGCGACADACLSGAVTMAQDAEGFLYPSVDGEKCTDCGRCAAVCPIDRPAEPVEGKYYALRCADGPLLQKSSSGGAFSLLAEELLSRGALVCGAAFDESFRVRHVLSRDIAPMRKSKYIQSDTAGIFKAVRAALKDGGQVFFTGTPCQCRALELFLGGRPAGLVIAALICRGVQPPGLWADYTAYLSEKGPLEAYDFRGKLRRDGGHTVTSRVNGEERAVPMNTDRFSRLFLKTLTLRPCCYACPFCTTELDFDFTIGDFWGVERLAPELADGLGASVVIARGSRAGELMEAIASRARVLPCSREEVLQPALQAPAKESILRRLLFRDLAQKLPSGRCDMETILKKYGG